MVVSSLSRDQGQLGCVPRQARGGCMSLYWNHWHSHTSFAFPTLLQGSLYHWHRAFSASPEARARRKDHTAVVSPSSSPPSNSPGLCLVPGKCKTQLKDSKSLHSVPLKENDFSLRLHILFSPTSHVRTRQHSQFKSLPSRVTVCTSVFKQGQLVLCNYKT